MPDSPPHLGKAKRGRKGSIVHSVLNWKIWLVATWACCVAIVGVRLLTGADLLPALQSGVSLTSLLVTVFVVTPLWRALWFVPWFKEKAPLLDGEWTGVVRSNWSIIEATKSAAKQAGAPSVDLDGLDAPRPALFEVPVRARIRCSFFALSLELESDGDRYQTSSLKSVQLKPTSEGSPATLRYIFEGRVLQPKAGDASCFDGAASLSIRRNDRGVLFMEGPTWTNRAWERGLNTAGVIRLEKTTSA